MTTRRVLNLRVGRRGHPCERTIITRVPVIDPTRLRVERMMTDLVLWTLVDFDRDDTFRSVLGPHQELPHHGRACRNPISSMKTSLASIYGLMSETSPAFHLPVSPLVRSLLDDTNLSLSKFFGDQTVHGCSACARSPSLQVLSHLLFLVSGTVLRPFRCYLNYP